MGKKKIIKKATSAKQLKLYILLTQVKNKKQYNVIQPELTCVSLSSHLKTKLKVTCGLSAPNFINLHSFLHI